MRNPVLVGNRVYLRPKETADAENSTRWSANEDDTEMYRGRAPISPILFAEQTRTSYSTHVPGWVPFAVCLIEGDVHIGNVSVNDIDWVNRTGETGSFFAPQYRSRGLGTEAKHLLLEYYFDWLHLHALYSEVAETNPRSAAALAKQGYRPAGRTRWVDVKDGGYVDWLVFTVTRPDWLAAREAWRAREMHPSPGPSPKGEGSVWED